MIILGIMLNSFCNLCVFKIKSVEHCFKDSNKYKSNAVFRSECNYCSALSIKSRNFQKEQKYLERHRVKCGITGWAQVNGLRGTDTSLQTRIDYDIYYIENWSIAFDIKIIFKTIKEVLFSKEAF